MKSPCFFVFALMICITHAVSESVTQDSYTKHCSSLLPRYNVTARSDRSSLPSLSTSYFTGGKRFQGGHPDRAYSYDQKNLRLRLQSDPYKTTADGVYKVDGFLRITFASSFDDVPGERPSFRFPVDGFWSEKSRTLCMVGSISWEAVDYEAVLKLKFDDESPTIYTGVVSGSLESTASADDEAYFDPILIFDFPTSVAGYNYLQVSEEIGAAFSSRRDESLSLDSNEFCSLMERGLMSLELEYAAECAEQQPRPHHCSPVSADDDFLPNYVSVISVQCAKGAKKARFLAMFQNYTKYGYFNFLPSSTVIGEAWWDEKSNGIIGVACPILNPSLHFGNAVGDCTVRLSLRLPSVLTMRNDARIVGEIRSFKAAAEGSDYFRQINLTINERYAVEALVPDQRYKYTELERVRKSCPQKKAAAEVAGKKKGGDDVYPDAQSFEMRFDLNVQSNLASAYATPLLVENDPFKGMSKDILFEGFSQLQKLDGRAVKWDIIHQPTKMSYKITVQPSSHAVESGTNVSIPSHIWPVTNPSGEVAIKAEGFYDARNGQLCMVGCRKLAKNAVSTFKDCELVVELELPPLKGGRGRLIKGILRSTRLQTDPLHFDDLVMESFGYNGGEAMRSLWRMDMEIAMVLISSTLLCTFVALQIFHLKRNPEVVSSVSLFMLVVLCAGHVIPLVLNVEAMFSDYHDKTTVDLGNGGRLEANEVAVRVITLVALLLQLRLLQLVSTSKKSFSAEWRAGFVSASFYVLGCLLTLMLRNTHSGWRYSAWGYLRSYCGVILDGFLLPQILLNIFRGSAEKALRRSFYVGTSAVRLAPHVYNQYRCHNYPKNDLKQTYYYANPAADMYSTAWDIIIPCGIIALSVIVSLQQRKGGRCILPQRFSVLEKVPAPDNN